jgi:hypothetical protein
MVEGLKRGSTEGARELSPSQWSFLANSRRTFNYLETSLTSCLERSEKCQAVRRMSYLAHTLSTSSHQG